MRRVVAVLCVLAALGIAATLVTIAVVHSRSRSAAAQSARAVPTVSLSLSPSTPRAATLPSGAGSGTSPTLLAAAQWMTASIAPDTPISADGSVNAQLRSAGFTSLRGLPGTATNPDWHADAYLVQTAAIRASKARPVLDALNSSAPVALFGRGNGRIEVRKIDPVGPADLAMRITNDKLQRQEAGHGLLQNKSLHPDATVTQALQKGALDLRAATVLAVLAEKDSVAVMSVPQSQAEAAAQLPVRTITISMQDSTQLTDALLAVPLPYRPLTMTPVAGGAMRLQWDVSIAPVASLT